ncbi:hypothetical protein M422DRAFT_783938 [Sphaerobolus stellatus SS14]|uniref:Heme haloperoxidase family profile domain-containing protein n=1 Tax=Sphaerobolus stellatus (strain SS14) TaxID=990650 RepID=A0A0C9UNY2_SPHS4|nr:hypothetical protein M422DRAFT_783938 [Sphaerobolus stellatus SS14]
MEGLNLGNDFAKCLAYQVFLMNVNPITYLISLGFKSSLTGQDFPRPAQVGRLGQHGTFEDASMTRIDAHFGDQTLFSETLFQTFIATSGNSVSTVRLTSLPTTEIRHDRLVDSIKTNPELFVDGRLNNRRLDLDIARGFFQTQKMPADFHRQPAPVSFEIIEPLVSQIFNKFPFTSGAKHGKNSYITLPKIPARPPYRSRPVPQPNRSPQADASSSTIAPGSTPMASRRLT